MRLPDLHAADIEVLENEIDRMNEVLEPMKHFIIPGGHPSVSHIHVARCICRRAERACVRLELESLEVDPLVLQYLNRLSDYLFVLARYAGKSLEVPEIPWKPRLKS
jgi:cob(I)alamin adenosyltransferase